MKRILTILLPVIMFVMPVALNAQIIVFQEDFDGISGPTAGGPGTYSFAPGWTLINQDGLTPNTAVSYVNDAWERREDFANNVADSAAFSTSWYTPAGTANDWMITPAIAIPTGSTLSWNALAYDAAYPDGYEVRIAASPTYAAMIAGTVLFSTTAEANAWTPHTVSLAPYAGQTRYIGFRNNATDMFLLLVDDVTVTQTVANDVQMLSANLPTQYTIMPSNEVTPLTFSGVINNAGSSAATNVRFQVTVRKDNVQVYQANSNTVGSLASLTSTPTLTAASFTPSGAGTYEVQYLAQMAATDQVHANDTLFGGFLVDPYTYARDNGVVTGALGIGAGNGGYLGQSYDVPNNGTVGSVGVYYTAGYTGRPYGVAIWNMAAGTPSTILTQTTPANYPDDSARYYIIPFPAPVSLTSGQYAFTAVEFDSTVQVGQTDDNFVQGTTWVNWPTSPLGGWGNNEDFGANFSKPYVIRPNFCPTLTPAVSITQPICAVANGSASVTLTGAEGPLTYAWSTGATTSSISNLAAGSYTCTITDAFYCRFNATANVTTNSVAITGTVNATPASCGQNIGTATFSATNGVAPYTYSWSNGSTTQTITGLAAGSYNITTTDANGCTGTAVASVTTANGPSATAAPANVTCAGLTNGAVNITVSGGSSPYTYLWSTGATTEDINGLGAGSYSCTITDNASCNFVVSSSITAPAALGLGGLPTIAQVTCNGACNGSITNVVIIGGVTPYSYAWSNGTTTANLINLCPGSYTGTVTDANGCIYNTPFPVVIGEPNALGIDISTLQLTGVSCNGGSDGSLSVATIGGTQPYTYLWSNGATTSGLVNVPAGAYTGTITDANGCTYSPPIPVNITEPAALAITGTVTDELNGNDGAISLVVSGGTGVVTYAWSNGATTEDITGLAAGNYSVTLTDANGCTSTDAFTIAFVNVNMLPEMVAMSVYPNPAVAEFNINLEFNTIEQVQIDVVNVTGQIVATRSLSDFRSGVVNFDTRAFAAGNYMVRVNTARGTTSTMVTVK